MSEMVERVAKAVFDAWESKNGRLSGPYENQTGRVKEIAQAQARGAIEAMREPTEAMTDAAYGVKVFGADLHDFVADDCAGPIYRAMIDEALK